jgi:hypothetical protein
VAFRMSWMPTYARCEDRPACRLDSSRRLRAVCRRAVGGPGSSGGSSPFSLLPSGATARQVPALRFSWRSVAQAQNPHAVLMRNGGMDDPRDELANPRRVARERVGIPPDRATASREALCAGVVKAVARPRLSKSWFSHMIAAITRTSKLRFTLMPLCGVALAAVCVIGTATTPFRSAQAPRALNVAYSDLSLITEPGPGDRPFLQAVQSAKSSVDLVMYELSDPSFERALVSAERRGVQVRVLLNGGYYGGGSSANKAAYSYLKANGVPVRWSPSRFALTHQKTLVVDDKTAYIMTLNLVEEDYSTSRDFAVADTNSQDVSAIETTFTADWNNQSIKPSDGADLVWSPGALGAQLSLINSAKHTLEIYNEEMGDSTVTSALEAAARRGVDVKIVMTHS